MPSRRSQFDPRSILAALERNYVDYVVIGGLAQVLRGADLTTDGVDICPSFASGNLDRLVHAVDELGAKRVDGQPLTITEDVLGSESVLALTTSAGMLQVIGSPVGAESTTPSGLTSATSSSNHRERPPQSSAAVPASQSPDIALDIYRNVPGGSPQHPGRQLPCPGLVSTNSHSQWTEKRGPVREMCFALAVGGSSAVCTLRRQLYSSGRLGWSMLVA